MDLGNTRAGSEIGGGYDYRSWGWKYGKNGMKMLVIGDDVGGWLLISVLLMSHLEY